jgi:hypothetical protein
MNNIEDLLVFFTGYGKVEVNYLLNLTNDFRVNLEDPKLVERLCNRYSLFNHIKIV